MEIKQYQSKYFRYLFIFDYDWKVVSFCRHLKLKYGYDKINFVKEQDNVGWGFSSKTVLDAIRNNYPDIVIPVDLSELSDEIKPITPEVKTSLNSDFDTYTKLPLRKFQREGVDFIKQTEGKCLIADEMGTGKTIQAITYAHLNNFHTLVICPASIKLVWQDEISKFTNRTSIVLYGKDLTPKKITELDLMADFVIINYDIIGKAIKNGLDFTQFDLVVLDESHLIKSHKAQRTRAVKQLGFIPRRVLLTGTPVLNRPAELWSQLNFIEPFMFPNYWKFTLRYADAHQSYFGWDVSGASNLDELRDRIRGLMIRRTKQEVLSELPPKIETLIRIDMSPDDKAEYQRSYSSLEQILFMRGSQANQLVILTYMKQVCAEAKIKNAIEIIKNIIETNGKIVLFSQFLEPLHILKEKFGDKAVLLEGSMSSADRKLAVDKFQNDDNIILFLGSVMAAGFGITLTASQTVIFLDLPWTPAIISQASDRLHRIGQRGAVNCYYLLTNNTIELDIYNLLQRKMAVIKEIMNEDEILKIKSQSVLPDLMKRLREQTRKKKKN